MNINTGRPTDKTVKGFHPVSLGLSSVFLQTTCGLPRALQEFSLYEGGAGKPSRVANFARNLSPSKFLKKYS